MGPEGYELASLIDLDRVQRLCDSLSEAFDVTLAVLDLSGNVLIATGWQDICTRYPPRAPRDAAGVSGERPAASTGVSWRDWASPSTTRTAAATACGTSRSR